MFKTELDVRVVSGGKFKLLSNLLWDDGEIVDVPKGFLTDFASIPRVVQNVIKVNGPHRRSAVPHDYLYVIQDRPRAEVDALFLKAMKADGVSWLMRTTMYSAVRIGGWLPWNHNDEQLQNRPLEFLRSHGLDAGEWGNINET